MKLCVDMSAALQQGAGIARYSRELLSHMLPLLNEDRVTIFTNNGRQVHVPAPLDRLPCLRVSLDNRRWRLRVAANYLFGGGLDAAFGDAELFFAPDHLLPRLRRIPTVLVIYDLSYLLLPEYHSRFSGTYQRLMMPHFARQASRIMTPSHATRRDLVSHYGLNDEQIMVIPGGVEARFLQPVSHENRERVRVAYKLPHRFLLYVGTLEPRKNIRGLLEAFAALVARGEAEGVDLVLAGRPGWLYQPTLDRIRELGLEQRILRIGYVADADLPALYASCEAFVFPSFYEGFGLPPLEAMACGAPVVVSSAASLPEVVGEGGILIDPTSSHQLSVALQALLADEELRRRLRAAGPVQAARFGWERAARSTLDLLRETYRAHRY